MASAPQESRGSYTTDRSGRVKVTILASEWGSSRRDLATINKKLGIQLAKSSDVEISFLMPQCSEEDKREALRHSISIVEAPELVAYEKLYSLSFPPDDLQIEVVIGLGVELGRHAQVIRKFRMCKWVQVVHTNPEERGMLECYADSISRGEEKHKDEVKLCDKADFVVGIGPKMAETFRSYLRFCKNNQTIFNFTPGIFEEFLTVEQVPEEGNHRSVLVFGCGDVKDFKLNGFDIAGKAIASLADTHLVFVGAPDGKHEEVKESFMQCGVPAKRLRVRSYDKSQESLKQLFCEVDLVVVPSRMDGFGLTGLEALSAGLPVLASKNSGFGEALCKVPFCSAFVIDSDIPDVWTAAIKNIIWDKDRQCRLEEAENMRILYDKKYSWTKQSDALRSKIIKLARASLQLKIDGVPITESNGQKGTGTEIHPMEPQEVSQEVHRGVEWFHTFCSRGSETERGHDLGDEGRKQGMSSVSENQSLCIEKGLHLVIVVDPDVMEFVTTTSHHDELKKALSVKKSEIKWTPQKKTAIVVFRGDDETNLWQSECIELVQSYLRKFAKHDVEVKKEFWEAVKTQLFDVRACLGLNPPLIKPMEESFCARVICMSTDAKGFKDQVEAKLEEIYREETRKTYLKFSKSISEERLILLKEIKFFEKLQQHNKELEITLDTDAEEIYFEGPQEQLKEAAMKFHKLDQNIVEKKLSISESILEVLGSDEGLQRLKSELEKNNVEAVFVIDNEVRIVGTSAAQADQAASLVGKLTSEEKIHVDEKNQHLLKTSDWRQLCDELNTGEVISVYRNNWSDTFVAGFREDVTEGVKKLNDFLENNCIRKELFSCPSKRIRRYLSECRQDDLRLIENQLASFEVKVENGKEEDFVIFGNKEGLKRAREELNTIVAGVICKVFDVKQPGLRKFYASGKGDHLKKTIEKNYECAIHVEKSFDSKREEGKVQGTQGGSDSTSSDDEDEPSIAVHDDNYDVGEAVVSETDRSSFATKAGHQVSWRAGVIEAEKVDVLVSSQGECSQAILTAGGAAMRKSVIPRNTGHITVTPGFALPCSHVIHTICSPWNAGSGEAVLRDIVQRCLQKGEELRLRSMAFPVIGTRNLKFPPNEASRIMLEEIFSFCQTNASSNLKDIRFVLYQQDKALITAFKQEMASLVGPNISKYRGPSIEVINADLTQEKTDAILNIISTDMNMNNAGELGKAILKRGGPQIQQECSQLGIQIAGSAVMTSGGNLAAPKVIHIIPGSKDKQHLQTCLEAGLRLADKHRLRSLSIPCVGTGGYGLSAADSSQVTFQALNNFSLSCQSVRKVRVVVFKASMMQEFLQSHQRHTARNADHKFESDSSSKHTTNDPSVKICVAGKDATSVEKAVDSLKSGFLEACMTQKVENEAVNQLSRKQIDSLRKKANDRDVRLDIEADIDRIVVRGEPTEVTGMVGEIWHEINERNKKIKEKQQGLLVSKHIEWSYEIQGAKVVFDLKTNTKLEMAHVKNKAFVSVSLRADEFDINLKAKTGQGRQNGETITIHRKVKGSDEGIPLPEHWDPMPSSKTVLLVPLLPGSSEYRQVAYKVSLTTLEVNIQKIERIQNPHLYQSYVVRKQKIDKDNGGNNERQLFHGTKGENVKAINTQGFNRRFCGENGVKFGQGVYFARDASYSVQYATGGAGSRYMYLARVLVGKYCVGNSAMKNPPPKDTKRPEILYDSVVNDTSNPSIFVVFHDTQYYPEYLITF